MKRKWRGTLSWAVSALGIALVTILAGITGACDGAGVGTSEPTPATAVATPAPAKESQPPSIAQRMADADKVSEDAPKYQALLSRLTKTYTEGEEQIAEITLVTRHRLNEKKIAQGVIPIMEALASVYPADAQGKSYSEAAEQYFTLRSKASHKDTTVQLKARLQAASR